MTPPSAAPGAGFLAGHLLGASIGWASGFLFVKLASADASPLAIAAARGVVATLALGALFLVRGRGLRPRGREWGDWAVLGTLNGWVPNLLVASALAQIGAAPAAMIQASGPLMTAVLSHLLFAEERLTPRRLAGVLVGFGGIGILVGPAAFGTGPNAAGALAMLATAASYALGNVYVRGIPGADPARLALGQQLFSAVPAVALAFLVLDPAAAFAGLPRAAPWLAALGIFGTAVPILLFMRLIRAAGPTRAAMVGYLVPVWATLLAVLFLGERVGSRELLGGLVVLAGVATVSATGRLKPGAAPARP